MPSSRNPFDQAARYAAKIDPPALIRWLIPELDESVQYRGWLDTRTLPFPGEADRICDTVARLENVTDATQVWAFPIEFQAEPHPEMLGRLLEYLARLWREMRPEHAVGRFQVSAALLNLTGPEQPREWETRLPGTRFGLSFRVVQKTLRAEDAITTLAAIESGQLGECLLPWIPLMRNGGESSIIERWVSRASLQRASHRRSVYAGLARVFADLAGRHEEWKQALGDWNMLQSQSVLEWQAEASLKTRREDVLRLLKARFRKPVPKDIVGVVNEETDQDMLARWIDLAATVETVRAFRDAVAK